MHVMRRALTLLVLTLLCGRAVPLGGQPAAGPGGTFDVRRFGATGQRAEAATRPIQDAIDACFRAGGGVVYVPPGEYTTGAIELKDNVNLQLEAGATLLLSQDPADFAARRSMIYARGAKNIAVTGRGTLDGLAQYEWTEARGQDPQIARETEIARQAGVDMRRYYRTGMQTYMFILDDCIDVRLEGITVINSPLWNVRLNDCDRVFIRGVHIYSDLEKGVNSDGIDIVSSSNVIISDSIVVTADDAIVIKTVSRGGKPAGAAENITVTNCIVSSSSAALKIGTETEGDIRHVIFSNTVVRHANKALGIDVMDGGEISDILFSHLTIDTNRRHWNWWGSGETFNFLLTKRRPDSKMGAIRNVVMDNIMSHARGTSTITGHPERRIENVTISSLQMFMQEEDYRDKRATDAIQAQRVDGLKLRNVSVKWAEDRTEPKWASAASFRDVSLLELDNFSSRQGLRDSSDPALLFENVNGAVVRDSRADDGCGVFLALRGARTRDVRLRNNELEAARKIVVFETPALKKALVEEK
jgi:polygalacturonase